MESQLQGEIEDVRSDIAALETEISAIEKEKIELLSKLEQIQDEVEHEECVTAITKEPVDDPDIPSALEHSHFDPSISRYFSMDTSNPSVPPPLHPIENDQVKALVDLKENILHENIYRIGGITAFPLNRHLFSEDSEILGLRFDIFSHTKCIFLTPHYVILRKVVTTDKQEQTKRHWSVYRHTLPVFIPLEKFIQDLILDSEADEQSALADFTGRIRHFLVSTQYKHDKLEELKSKVNSTVTCKVEQDLQCQRVLVTMASKNSLEKSEHKLELNCSIDTVESVHFSTNCKNKSNQAEACKALLQGCHFNDLIATFTKVVKLFQ